MLKYLLPVVALNMPFYASAADPITVELVKVFSQAAQACDTTYTGFAGMLLKSTCKKNCNKAAERTRTHANYQQGEKQIKKDVNSCVLTLDLSKKNKPPILVKLKQYKAGIRAGTWPASSELAKNPRQQAVFAESAPVAATPALNTTKQSIFGGVYPNAHDNIRKKTASKMAKLSLAKADWTNLNAKQVSLTNEIYQQALNDTLTNTTYNLTDEKRRNTMTTLFTNSRSLETKLAEYREKTWSVNEVFELATQEKPGGINRLEFTQTAYSIAVLPLMEQFIKSPQSLTFQQFADLHHAVNEAKKSSWTSFYGVGPSFMLISDNLLLEIGKQASLATAINSTQADRKVAMDDFLADSISNITGMDPMMAKIEAHKQKQQEQNAQNALEKRIAAAPPVPSPPYRFDWAEIDQVSQIIKLYSPSENYPQGIGYCVDLLPDSPNRIKADFKATMASLNLCVRRSLPKSSPMAGRLLARFAKDYRRQYNAR